MPGLSAPTAAAGISTAPQRPHFEGADVGREYGAAFRATPHGSPEQEKVRQAIEHGRTAALGGQVEGWERCGTEPLSYNSCRNRHCPQCPGAARAKGLAAEQALLLPVPYFYLVFTLPPLLNPLGRLNPRALYPLLFQTVARTLRQFARDPQHLGAELGFTAVLHTWGEADRAYPRARHCDRGGLSAEGTQWRPSHPRFLLAVAALSQVLQGQYLAGLRRLRAKPKLRCAGESAALA
jgi:hypothetical protein